MDTVHLGLIGTRRGGFVTKAAQFFEHMDVCSVFDVDLNNASRCAADLENCQAFGPEDWEAFLDSGINAVVIASPIPFHTEQSVDCLQHNLHVLAEVTPVTTLTEAKALVQAVTCSKATYMLAENLCFLDEVELFKRMHADKLLGDIYHVEGGYLHDCRKLWRNEDGTLTWRGQGRLGVYCTHPLGPILDLLEDRIVSVSCLATPNSIFDEQVAGLNNHNMLMRTERGCTVSIRVDHMSPQPYRCSVSFQGTSGLCAYAYGYDKEPRICLGGEHQWTDAQPYVSKYLADRQNLAEEARDLGHGSMEYWMMKAWLDSLLTEAPVPIDVHKALDYTLPGILAEKSAEQEGAPFAVPDSRDWLVE